MAVKETNEITLKVNCNMENLIEKLTSIGFKEINKFILDDIYYVPKHIELDKSPTREILANSLLIRYVEGNYINKYIIYKIKNFNEDGDIIDQKSIKCSITNIDEAIKLVEAIGYKELMIINEKDIVYANDDLELAIKSVNDKYIFMEVETNEHYDDVEKLKKAIDDLKLPVEPNQYFVKKAEIILNEKLGRN